MAEENSKKLCFVIGPIGSEGSDERCHADWLLNGIIRPVFAEHFSDYKVERADKIVLPGSINSQVITRIMDAPLVIADMSMHNANAFYELAIRHMVGLPTIHMIGKEWKIPFDVAPYRAITFSRIDYADIEAARNALRSTVEEVIKPDFVVENPITHARGVVKIREHASDELRVILDEMQSLRERVDGAELTALLASQDAQAAQAALNILPSDLPVTRQFRNQMAHALATFNPATPPPMITAPSNTQNPAPKMGEIYGLAPSSSNQTLGEILGTALKKAKEEKEEK